ncbi:MAG: SURF1 family protein [Jannaschia sp.]
MRLIFPLLLGLVGFAVLVSLGIWQVQRLAWKEDVIARIEGRIGADPVPLPSSPDPAADNFLPVTVSGRIVGAPLRVLGAWRGGGSGFRIVAPFEVEDRSLVMVDLGLLPLDTVDDRATVDLPLGPLIVIGNLAWPDDANAGTPGPDGTTWFARDVDAMADALETRRVLVVAREVSPPAGPTPLPVGVEGIPNSHLGYAIQWFGLALVWAGMTLYLLWRIRRRTV